MTQQTPLGGNAALFNLEYPQSLGVFDSYADAQKAVDQLADADFPVKNLAIVGTDLRLMERVTGRRTWGTVLGQGVTSGLSTGFIVAIVMMILQPQPESFFAMLLTAILIGVVIGLVFAILGYVLSRGQRDFTSVSQTIATKYEVLCEHKVAAQARELLDKNPATRGQQFNQPPRQQPYAGYGNQQSGYGNQQPGYGQGYPPPPGYGQQGWGQPYPEQPGQGYPAVPGQAYPEQPDQGYAPYPGASYPAQPEGGVPSYGPPPGYGAGPGSETAPEADSAPAAETNAAAGGEPEPHDKQTGDAKA